MGVAREMISHTTFGNRQIRGTTLPTSRKRERSFHRFADATGGDGVFRQLVLARIFNPQYLLDGGRVLEEAGVVPASYPAINRRLRARATGSWREKLSAACAARAGLGPASLVLYDVST